MRTFVQLLAVGGMLVATGILAGRETVTLPRLPMPVAVKDPTGQAMLTQSSIRGELHEYLPTSELLIRDETAPGGQAGVISDGASPGEPHTVAAHIGVHPIIDFADSRYFPVQYDYIPVLLDWFEGLTASLGYTPAETREVGFRSNKVARLMRVFTSIRIRRSGLKDPGMAPAIGWCRVLFREDWHRCKRGETHTLVLMATDRGWFAIDPYTRAIRQLQPKDPRWIIEFVVM